MVHLTELAARKVKQQLEKRGKGLGITVGVKPTGCSGLAYKLEYIDNPPVTRDWFRYESNGVTIWVNGKDLPYIEGLTMEWKKQGLNEGFDFINEKEKDRCGCGESFRI